MIRPHCADPHQRLICAIAAFLLTVFLAGCNESPAPSRLSPRSASFNPDQFPDIPLPVGYAFNPADEQLAVSLAGGSVRRFEVSLVRRDNAPLQTSAEALDACRRELTTSGWQPLSGSDAAQQHWRKEGEELVVEAGRADGRTTIRFHLRPAALSAP